MASFCTTRLVAITLSLTDFMGASDQLTLPSVLIQRLATPGAAIGAVSGVGLAAVKKGEPIRVPSGTLLEFTISQPTRLPVSK
jgi:hypothetical protein